MGEPKRARSLMCFEQAPGKVPYLMVVTPINLTTQSD